MWLVNHKWDFLYSTFLPTWAFLLDKSQMSTGLGYVFLVGFQFGQPLYFQMINLTVLWEAFKALCIVKKRKKKPILNFSTFLLISLLCSLIHSDSVSSKKLSSNRPNAFTESSNNTKTKFHTGGSYVHHNQQWYHRGLGQYYSSTLGRLKCLQNLKVFLGSDRLSQWQFSSHINEFYINNSDDVGSFMLFKAK